MIAPTAPTTGYVADFARLDEQAGRDGPGWLRDLRRQALGRFTALGFPTLQDEEWRFTSVEPIATTPFALLEGQGPRQLAAEDVARFDLPGLAGQGGSRLVFIDGRYAPQLSSVGTAGQGVIITGLAEALGRGTGVPPVTGDAAELVRQHLARNADFNAEAFTALNTAFIEDGAFVFVPPGTALAGPIHVLCIATARAGPIVTHPRHLVVAGSNSQLTIVEHYVAFEHPSPPGREGRGEGAPDDPGPATAPYLTNAVTEIVVGDNAVVSHYLLEEDGPAAFNISTLAVRQGRDSDFRSHSVLTGGALVRNNVNVVLAGDGAASLLNGLYMPAGRQHMDNHMRVEHVGRHGASRQFYKGILAGASRGVFGGRIIVRPGAVKTDAKQVNKNLLLSDAARVDTKPQLEIRADDVKCTHGATIGQLDADAVFYLCSRGISEPAARDLLVYAFAGESIARMELDPVRRRTETAVLAHLPHAKLLEGVL